VEVQQNHLHLKPRCKEMYHAGCYQYPSIQRQIRSSTVFFMSLSHAIGETYPNTVRIQRITKNHENEQLPGRERDQKSAHHGRVSQLQQGTSKRFTRSGKNLAGSETTSTSNSPCVSH